MRVCLIPLDDGEPIELTQDVTLVGRRSICDVRLKHPSVSKVHVVLVKTDGAVFFRDLASTNGTRVNGQQVRRGALLPDDELSIAACSFKVQFLTEEEPEGGANGQAADEPAQSPAVRRVYRADELDQDDQVPVARLIEQEQEQEPEAQEEGPAEANPQQDKGVEQSPDKAPGSSDSSVMFHIFDD